MNRIVSREEWNRERIELLEAEKEWTRSRDVLGQRRRDLPWVRVEKDYAFVGEKGTASLDDLFAGRRQLVVYHFMYGEDWEDGCPSCSLWTDDYQGALPHLAERDVTLVSISTAPYPRLSAYRNRMGWNQDWYSSGGSDFNRDFHVSYSDSDLEKGETFYNYKKGNHNSSESPGLSVFYRESPGQIFHTYSCYGRGLEDISLVYRVLDLVPKGRDEEGLQWPMQWVKIRDQYEAKP